MSWQLASFAIVIGALVMAFWWYERSRPSAKLVAVVATLAALAALGRDAFAAVPDVKPITAIVLVSGVAFGAGPGFAVGAISGLASNILLGQGPWTPWQMLGWGLVGLIGAALARPLGERPSRVALALSCAFAAAAFNIVLDLSTWTAAGNHSVAAFGVVLGSALVFDLTHVVASFAFGLAFAGALLRMLLRVRSRLDVSWVAAPSSPPAPVRPLTGSLGPLALVLAAVLLAGGLGAGGALPARADSGPEASAARAALTREIAYLAAAQNSDGGFGGARGQASTELYSAWASIGLAAAGRSPLTLRRDGHTVLDAIRGEAQSLHGAGDLERTILALRAAGVSTRSLPGGNPVARLLRLRSSDGSFADLVNQTAFAMLALRAAGYAPGSTPIAAGGSWLARQQEPDGGFGFAAKGGGSDVDDTAAVLQALTVAGRRSGTAAAGALRYLLHAQNPDGGYPQESGGISNAQSTSWAIQGLIAAGRDPAQVRRGSSRSPLGYLESLIAPDGSVRYSRIGAQTPVWVTAQALTALAGKPLPVGPVNTRRTTAKAASPGSTAVAKPVIRAVAATSPSHGPGAAEPGRSGLQAGTRALRELLGRLLGFLEG